MNYKTCFESVHLVKGRVLKHGIVSIVIYFLYTNNFQEG